MRWRDGGGVELIHLLRISTTVSIYEVFRYSCVVGIERGMMEWVLELGNRVADNIIVGQ